MSVENQTIPVEILLWGIQSPINTGIIMRIVEMYQLGLGIYDPFNIFKEEGKLRTISDFSCGAFSRHHYRNISGINELKTQPTVKRIIATTIDEGSISLGKFEFKANDCIVFGNEYDGIPAEIIKQADYRLHIPTPKIFLPKHKSYSPIDSTRSVSVANDGVPSHNVSVSVGIISHAIYMQSLIRSLQ